MQFKRIFSRLVSLCPVLLILMVSHSLIIPLETYSRNSYLAVSSLRSATANSPIHKQYNSITKFKSLNLKADQRCRWKQKHKKIPTSGKSSQIFPTASLTCSCVSENPFVSIRLVFVLAFLCLDMEKCLFESARVGAGEDVLALSRGRIDNKLPEET
jgi:hypothetical protein